MNLSKTKIMALNISKAMMDRTHLSFRNSSIETTISYTYLEVLFSGPIFFMRSVVPSKVHRGYVVLSTLER